jgi:hypothetical protein
MCNAPGFYCGTLYEEKIIKNIVANVKVGLWCFIVFKINNTPTAEIIRNTVSFLGIKQ